MAFGNSVAKSMNSPEIILSLIRDVTGGSDTASSCGVRPNVVVVTAPGIVLVPDVAQGTGHAAVVELIGHPRVRQLVGEHYLWERDYMAG